MTHQETWRGARGRRRGEGGRAFFLFTGGKLLHFVITTRKQLNLKTSNFNQSHSQSRVGGLQRLGNKKKKKKEQLVWN